MTRSKTVALTLFALFAGLALAPPAVTSQPRNEAVQYTNNVWSCTQTASTIDVSAASPTQVSFYNEGADEVYLVATGATVTATTALGVRVDSGQTYTVILREGYVRSISCVCASSETATVRVGGHR